MVFGFKAPTPNTYGRLLQNSQVNYKKLSRLLKQSINQSIELYNGGAMAIDGHVSPVFWIV